MAKRKGSSTSRPRARKKVAKEERDAREVENAQRLDKLPQEVWEKILAELKGDDLFPLALSCRYFRQKQKELVEQTRQSGPMRGKRRLALKTDLERKLDNGQPASADYLRFCSKEKVPSEVVRQKAECIRCLAAFHGHLPLLQELIKPLEKLPYGITNTAARGGQLETLEWLKTQKGFMLDGWTFTCACESGHEIVRWFMNEGCPWNYESCASAAKGGHLEALKWLRSEGCPWDEYACTYAAEHGHLEALKWLRSEGCPWDEREACNVAAEGGHLEILKWFRSEGCYLDARECSHAAASGGHLETLKWLRNEGCPWDVWICFRAAEHGHLETLKWLRSEGCPWNANACYYAASGGHLEILKWLRSQGCPWDERTCEGAAWGGQLEVLKWLRSQGCPWDEQTCRAAALGGGARHSDVLQWAINNGCPYENSTYTRRALKSLGLA